MIFIKSEVLSRICCFFSVTSNPCDAVRNPCLSDGVSHTCRLQAGGKFKCKCKDGFVNDKAGIYCIGK